MNRKEFFNNIYIRNLLGLILVTVVLISGVMLWLNIYTRHGKSVKVPDVKGISVEKAKPFFAKSNLNYSVVDSVYIRNAVPGSIAETTPPVGSPVKSGRTVYLKVNAWLPQLIAAPDVKDASQRQSLAMLRSLGFENVTVKPVPGAYRDLVMGLESKGSPVAPGQRIPADTPLSLLVSSGSDDIMPLDNPSDTIDSVNVSSDESWF
jgi:beta-lactam-binding protein with PASTA domain